MLGPIQGLWQDEDEDEDEELLTDSSTSKVEKGEKGECLLFAMQSAHTRTIVFTPIVTIADADTDTQKPQRIDLDDQECPQLHLEGLR